MPKTGHIMSSAGEHSYMYINSAFLGHNRNVHTCSGACMHACTYVCMCDCITYIYQCLQHLIRNFNPKFQYLWSVYPYFVLRSI